MHGSDLLAPLDYLTAWDRLAGYRHALLDAGLPFRPENVLDAAADLFHRPTSAPSWSTVSSPQAPVLTASSPLTTPFAAQDHRRVATERAQSPLTTWQSFGVDDLPCALEGEVPITTITFDGAGAARHILELIGQRLTAGDRYPTKGTVGLRVVPRASAPWLIWLRSLQPLPAGGQLTERKESSDS